MEEKNNKMVELTITVTSEFIEGIERSIDIIEQEKGYRPGYGEYIEESYYELINAIIELEHRLGVTHKPMDEDNPMHG